MSPPPAIAPVHLRSLPSTSDRSPLPAIAYFHLGLLPSISDCSPLPLIAPLHLQLPPFTCNRSPPSLIISDYSAPSLIAPLHILFLPSSCDFAPLHRDKAWNGSGEPRQPESLAAVTRDSDTEPGPARAASDPGGPMLDFTFDPEHPRRGPHCPRSLRRPRPALTLRAWADSGNETATMTTARFVTQRARAERLERRPETRPGPPDSESPAGDPRQA